MIPNESANGLGALCFPPSTSPYLYDMGSTGIALDPAQLMAQDGGGLGFGMDLPFGGVPVVEDPASAAAALLSQSQDSVDLFDADGDALEMDEDAHGPLLPNPSVATVPDILGHLHAPSLPLHGKGSPGHGAGAALGLGFYAPSPSPAASHPPLTGAGAGPCLMDTAANGVLPNHQPGVMTPDKCTPAHALGPTSPTGGAECPVPTGAVPMDGVALERGEAAARMEAHPLRPPPRRESTVSATSLQPPNMHLPLPLPSATLASMLASDPQPPGAASVSPAQLQGVVRFVEQVVPDLPDNLRLTAWHTFLEVDQGTKNWVMAHFPSAQDLAYPPYRAIKQAAQYALAAAVSVRAGPGPAQTSTATEPASHAAPLPPADIAPASSASSSNAGLSPTQRTLQAPPSVPPAPAFEPSVPAPSLSAVEHMDTSPGPASPLAAGHEPSSSCVPHSTPAVVQTPDVRPPPSPTEQPPDCGVPEASARTDAPDMAAQPPQASSGAPGPGGASAFVVASTPSGTVAIDADAARITGTWAIANEFFLSGDVSNCIHALHGLLQSGLLKDRFVDHVNTCIILGASSPVSSPCRVRQHFAAFEAVEAPCS